MEETRMTITGNLTRDPEMRFTEGGDAVCRFAVASTPRYMDRTTNEWKDGDPLFIECVLWRKPAENLAASIEGGLAKGARVIVTGVLKQRSYEPKDKPGETRTVYELTVDEIGASVRYATVAVTKVKSGGGRASGSGDPEWENAAKARPAAQGGQQQANGGGQQRQAQQDRQPAQAAAGGGFDDI